MIVHFASANWSDIASRLDKLVARSGIDYGGEPCWVCRPEDYLVLLYEYADHTNEFEPEDLQRLCALLGGHPSSAVCLELRRSKGRAAHDTASALAADLLRDFAGVVEDICGEVYWSLADLDAGMAHQAAERRWPNAEQAPSPIGSASVLAKPRSDLQDEKVTL
jgi:hypothetical protein